MDCDLQDSPELIPEFISAAKPPIEIVFARYVSRKDPYWRRLASRLYHKVIGNDTLDKSTLGTFSLFSNRARQAYLDSPLAGKAYLILLLRLGLKTTTVPCNKNQREIGSSSYTLWKLVKISLRAMFLFRPALIMMSVSCLLFMTIGLFVGLEILAAEIAWPLGIAIIFILTAGGLIIRNKLKAREPVSISKSVNLLETQRNFFMQ